jgi:hypothetical protein
MTEAAALEPGLRARVQALLRLIRDDPAVDRELAFSYVLWPTEAVEAALPGARGRNVAPAERERMAEPAAQGLSHRAIGEQVGRPRTTVTGALRGRGSVPHVGRRPPAGAAGALKKAGVASPGTDPLFG